MHVYIHRQKDTKIGWLCQYICTSFSYSYPSIPDLYLSFVNQLTDNGNRNSSISFRLHSQSYTITQTVQCICNWSCHFPASTKFLAFTTERHHFFRQAEDKMTYKSITNQCLHQRHKFYFSLFVNIFAIYR